MKYFLLPCFAALFSFNRINVFTYVNSEIGHTHLQIGKTYKIEGNNHSFTITGSATPGTISCNGGITTVAVTASGGVGNLTYNISGTMASGGNFTVTSSPQPNGNTYTFNSVPAGAYNVAASDENAETASIGSFTISQPASAQTNNGAPDVLLTSVITPSGGFPTPGSSITITYTINNKNNTSITAQDIVLRVSKPFTNFTVELTAASTGIWQKTTDATNYAEFMMKAGNQIPCSSAAQIAVIITRSGLGSRSSGVPVTGVIYFLTGPQDLNSYDNARSSQVRIQ